MTRFASSTLAALTAASGLMALTADSAFADTKVFQPDSICRGALLPELSTGTLVNTSFVNAVTIYCAINRDRTDLKPTLVQVTVVDNSSLLIGDGNFTCSLAPVSRNGVLGVSGGSVGTAGTNSVGQTLTLPIPVVGVDGTLTLKCKVPRRGAGDPISKITSIKIVEPDPTN
jgi:hypothetical protein